MSYKQKPKICREVEYLREPVPQKKHVRYGENGSWTAEYERVPPIPVSKDGWLSKGRV